MFAAYQNKLKGFRESQLIQTIPATSKFQVNNTAGEWFVNRHEVLAGTEILLEYRKRNPRGGFAEDTAHLLLVMSEEAPLWRLRLDLPVHHNSAVPCIFYEGRFEIVNSDKLLPAASIAVWRDYFALDKEFEISDILDPNQDSLFVAQQLEGRVKGIKAKTTIETTKSGQKRVRIRRTRRIKT